MYIKNILTRTKIYSDVYLFIKRCPLIINRNCYHNMIQNKYKSLYYTKKLSTNRIDNKNLSSVVTYSSDTDNEIETESDFLELDEHDMRGSPVNIRNLLYPNNDDQIISELNDCASVQQVFNIINKNETKLNEKHVSQVVLILWDLQKCFYEHIHHQNETNINRMLKSNSIMENYIQQVKQHEDFKKLIKLIEKYYNNLTPNALTCTLLYLNRIGVDISENIMQWMISRCEKEIENNSEKFPLTALSRFTVTVFGDSTEFWSILVTKNIIPIIISKLRTCDNPEDFKLLTICLNKLYQVVTNDTLVLYKKVAEDLLINNKISSNNHRTILKVLLFLNRANWNDHNVSLIRKYFYILKNNVNRLSNTELIQLFQVFQTNKEPADILSEIQECASNRLSEIEESNYSLETTLDLLSCIVSFSSPLQRPKYEKLAQHYIEPSLSPPSLSAMHKILYHIKTGDVKLCNKFWNKALENINLENPEFRLKKILNLCHKYMHFFTDMGNKYRYYHFENQMIKMLLEELDHGISGLITHQFSRIAAFIIAYSNDVEVLNMITNRINKIEHFSSIDCLNLSKGLQIAAENVNYKYINNVQKYFNSIKDVLNECTKNEILVKKNDELPNINILARGFMYRKGDMNSETFHLLLNNIMSPKHKFNSHIIKDVSFFLQVNDCSVPEVIDKMLEYVVENGTSILGNVVNKLLYLCFYLGYMPNEEFLKVSSDIIIRDKERLSGLAFLQSALSLCFYHQLPENLVTHIFSVDFLEKLDEELSNCYAKATYPIRVRSHMMQLNRAVCLDYPERNVPWFHQKYIESRKITTKKNYFHQKLLSTLEDVVEDKNCIFQDVTTPYGYHLDFELNLDKDSSFPRKIAFSIINQSAYSAYNTNLKGLFQLKRRHLEILGYDVFYENSYDWKDFYTHEQCVGYIKEKLWPKHKCISNIV